MPPIDTERHFLKKKRFDDDIWLISRVYAGSSCDLFLAFWPEEDEQVIIKAIKPEIDNENKPRIEERLLKEASTLEEFWNPSFPKVYDIRRTKEKDQLYLILEHFEGNSLRDFLNIHNEQGLSPNFLDSFLSQMQRILSYLHTKKKLCHLDLTPENVIVTSENEIKIIDFEEAQVIGQSIKVTRVRGKENYLPPEFENPQEGFIHSGAADIYALGVMLKEVFERTKGLKPSQKSFYQNIIRNCIARRPEARPSIENIYNLPSQSPMQEKVIMAKDFILRKRVLIASSVISVALLAFIFTNTDEKVIKKPKPKPQKVTQIKKIKVKPKKKPKKKPTPRKKLPSFSKRLNYALSKGDKKADKCVQSFGQALNLYRFQVKISPKTGKLIRVQPINQAPRRLIYCINESYSQVKYPISKSRKDITLIKEFTLK